MQNHDDEQQPQASLTTTNKSTHEKKQTNKQVQAYTLCKNTDKSDYNKTNTFHDGTNNYLIQSFIHFFPLLFRFRC